MDILIPAGNKHTIDHWLEPPMINWRSSYAFALHREQDSRWSEARLILGSFLIILLVGTIFLVRPSSHNGEVTFVNALFTATSAISVTGLGVVDTGTPSPCRGRFSC